MIGGPGRFDLMDKVVLITGGAQGIGLASAQQVTARGARVTLVDVDADELARAARSLNVPHVLTIVADVRDRAAMAAAVDQTVAHHGRLDVVVANAGVTPPPATLRTIDLEEIDRVIGINLTGVLNTVKPALEQVITNRGHVVVVSSGAAFSPGFGGASYMMTKAAVEQLGRSLRLELAPYGATAGVSYFGFVDTAMARATLDDDRFGQKLGKMLPWPLSVRVSASRAGRVLVDGITRRAPRTMTPRIWTAYSLLRGIANVGIDRHLAGSGRVHELVRELEARTSAEK